MDTIIIVFIPCGLICLGAIVTPIAKCVSQIVRTKLICEPPELTDDQVKHIAHMDAKTIL